MALALDGRLSPPTVELKPTAVGQFIASPNPTELDVSRSCVISPDDAAADMENTSSRMAADRAERRPAAAFPGHRERLRQEGAIESEMSTPDGGHTWTEQTLVLPLCPQRPPHPDSRLSLGALSNQVRRQAPSDLWRRRYLPERQAQ